MTSQKITIRNMVCPRCITTVENILESLTLPHEGIALGEVAFAQALSEENLKKFEAELQKSGFELITSRLNKIVESIKILVLQYQNAGAQAAKTRLSAFITDAMPYDYSYLSDLFSGVEGKSIEQYFIIRRIEKVKEMIVYDELSLTQIADEVGFSSVHHLSAQFKKVTGLTPSRFKAIRSEKRRSIDGL